MQLPDLATGIYRHYKGSLYLVLGYAHDANADTLYEYNGVSDAKRTPMGERAVVVYVGLELTGAHHGPRLAVRTAEDFLALVHTSDGSVCAGHHGRSCPGYVERRFTYVDPAWYG